ncbi:MerR family DNA-binding transcriptional regulator [Streptomyces sp. KL118A]|uniref:MerR family DNA-binding transcriptional regulator n=1 Tax=Streptomyces sp. KL118A TaxID=3045153 RepID=UPI00278BB863|nr:MerR family DNA-binding transcriptional regulator [Streptomyces sp. KL118A]
MSRRDAGEGGLRPVDLARAAGVSPQQIRNYADAGILPPAPRSPAGYRRFDAGHRQALLAYRALVRGHGSAAARAVMRAVHAGEVPRALALIDAGHALLHDQRGALRTTGEALAAVAEDGPTAPALPRSRLRIGEVAAHLGVRASALRVWEAAGLLTPSRDPGTHYRSYLPADVRDARIVHMLRQSHYLLPQIRPVLDDLRRSGGVGALRTALAQREAALDLRARAMLEGAAHLHRYLSDGPPAPESASSEPASRGPYRADGAPEASAQ